MLEPNPERLARYREGLEAAGYKMTGQRAAVCTALAAAKGHPNVQQIFDLTQQVASSISLATVYNTMATLKSLGLVAELSAPNDPCTHFELDTRPHANLMCQRCHTVYDAHLPFMDGIDAEVHAETGFKVSESQVVLIGICRSCQGQNH